MCQNEQLGCLVDPATGLTVRCFDLQNENQIKSFFILNIVQEMSSAWCIYSRNRIRTDCKYRLTLLNQLYNDNWKSVSRWKNQYLYMKIHVYFEF